MSKTPESLESYLWQVERELRDLPDLARTNEMREIESHLRAMIEQRGDVAAVLAQFGSARKIGRNLRRAWQRKQPEAWWRTVLAPIAGLLFFSLDVLIYNRLYDLINARFNDVLSLDWSAPMYCCFALWMLATFFCTGFIAGVASPRRGVWLTLAYLLYIAYGLLAEPSTFGDASDLYLALFLGIVCPVAALAGTYFGAHRGGKISARIESGGDKVFAHIAQGRNFLASIAGDKLNARI